MLSRDLLKYLRAITGLFVISRIGLWLHVFGDALVTREPDWYRVSGGEFLLSCAVIYLIVPPFGLILARRGNLIGLAILVLYALVIPKLRRVLIRDKLIDVTHRHSERRIPKFFAIRLVLPSVAEGSA